MAKNIWKSIALRAERRLTAGLVHHRWPAWSADGELLAFAVGDGADAPWVICDRRGRVARVLAGPADGGASFGPDGAFAFGRRAGATGEIWMTPGGSVPPVRLLGGDGRLYREPAFSPDGATLAFAYGEEPDGPTRIHAVELASGKRRALTADRARSDGRPAFSPDGRELFFEGTAGSDVAVYALDLSRNEVTRVTPTDTVSRRPAPLSHDLVVVERLGDEGRTRLVLIDRRAVRERFLDGETESERREPAAFRNKRGRARLAYVALIDPGNGEPRRFDVCTARVKGVVVGGEEEAQPSTVEVPTIPIEDHPETHVGTRG
jgi:hypothetical protein